MPAESHIVSTAADLASQVRARRVDPVAITSATLARISGDSRAAAAFRHQAIAAAHDEAVHRLGDCCRFGRVGEGFATVLDDLVLVLTEHIALEEKAALPLAEKSG